MTPQRSTPRWLDRLHLAYLGALPALATLAVLAEYGHPLVFPLFLGGIVAVSVYLAVVASYTPVPKSPGLALLTLVDGPLCAALAQRLRGHPYAFAIDSFLIDGLAVWLVIVALALMTSRPTQGQRIATVFFALVATATVLSLFWPYVRDNVLVTWDKPLWLGLGLIEALAARHIALKNERVVRDVDAAAMFIVVWLVLWIVALIAGNVLHEMRV